MRFKDAVKFNHRVVEASNAQTYSARIREAVDQNPGATARELGAIIFPSQGTDAATNRIAGLLTSLTKAKKNPIKRRRQDGSWRYYPTNYRMPYERVKEEEPKPEMVEKSYVEIENAVQEHQANMTQSATDHIVALAKDFVWDTGSHDIREFVKWIESRES